MMPVTLKEYVRNKVAIMSDLGIVETKKDKDLLKLLLSKMTSEIQIDNVCHDLIVGKTDVGQLWKKYADKLMVVG